MAEADVKKITNLIKIWIPVLTFVFGSLGSVVTQSFYAGSYARTIEDNEIRLNKVEQKVDHTFESLDEIYVRKENFEESVKRRDAEFAFIKQMLAEIKQEVKRR